MTKRKKRRPNLPEETLARARAELYGEEEAAKMVAKEVDEEAEYVEEEVEEVAEAVVAAPAKPKPTPKPRRPQGGRGSRQYAPAATTIDDLRKEYVYVIADMRSMGILAGTLFVALVVASLILV